MKFNYSFYYFNFFYSFKKNGLNLFNICGFFLSLIKFSTDVSRAVKLYTASNLFLFTFYNYLYIFYYMFLLMFIMNFFTKIQTNKAFYQI